jgi:hypothetical protein
LNDRINVPAAPYVMAGSIAAFDSVARAAALEYSAVQALVGSGALGTIFFWLLTTWAAVSLTGSNELGGWAHAPSRAGMKRNWLLRRYFVIPL